MIKICLYMVFMLYVFGAGATTMCVRNDNHQILTYILYIDYSSNQ